MSQWQLIFLQSRVNGAVYRGDKLPPHQWVWPKGTWFQDRLAYVREAAGHCAWLGAIEEAKPRALWL
jgi:hypothetical protein